MKTFISFLAFLLVNTSFCFAEEVLGIYKEQWSLTIDKNTLLGIGIFLGVISLTIAVVIGMYIDYSNNKCLNNGSAMDILKKRYAIGKIPYSQFGYMKRSLGESNPDISKKQM